MRSPRLVKNCVFLLLGLACLTVLVQVEFKTLGVAARQAKHVVYSASRRRLPSAMLIRLATQSVRESPPLAKIGLGPGSNGVSIQPDAKPAEEVAKKLGLPPRVDRPGTSLEFIEGANVFAHRGGRPENSLGAFRRVVQEGNALIELDVWQLKDGQLVVMHDPTVDRTTTGSGALVDLTVHDLEKIHLKGSKEPVPRLADVFDILRANPRAIALVEVKPSLAESPLVADDLVTLIGQYGLESQVVVMSFRQEILEAVRERNPSLHLGIVAHTTKIGNGHFDFINVNYNALTLESLAELRSKYPGAKVLAWTVNDIQEATRLRSLGVDGIITDRPEVITLR